MSKNVLLRPRALVALAVLFCCAIAIPIAKAAAPAPSGMPALSTRHHVVFQVSQNDAGAMNLALNNVVNIDNYYSKLGKSVQIEVVAYGPGLNMLREDTSPVKARLKQIKESIPGVTFSACNVTLQSMEKTEGKTIAIVPEAGIVPAGVARIMTLQEAGWSYIKP